MTLSNIIGCAGSVTFLLFVSISLPFFGPLLSLLTPLPFLFYSSKLGLNKGSKVCLVTILIVGVVTKMTGHSELFLFCLEFGIAGLILSELFRRELNYSLTIFTGTLLVLVVGSGFFLFISITRGLTPLEMAVTYLQTSLDNTLANTISLYESRGLDQQTIEQLKQAGPKIIDWVKKIYPSLVIIGTGFIVWINVIISKPLFMYRGIKYPDMGRGDFWQSPEYMVWGLIIAGFCIFFSIPTLELIAINAVIIFSVIYVFHGLSIVLFFFNKYNVPTWTRIIIFILIISQWIFFVIIFALMGLFDQWVDFRKINNTPQVSE
ncbi:DUF2232 domain-containing protein [Thermodesulfobacteriota bacterium]